MRTVIALAIGFWVGRQIYINFDKEEARQKEREAKKRLKKFLEENGLTVSEAKEQTNEILGTEKTE